MNDGAAVRPLVHEVVSDDDRALSSSLPPLPERSTTPSPEYELTNTILSEGQVRDLVEKMLETSGRRIDLSTRVAQLRTLTGRGSAQADASGTYASSREPSGGHTSG